MKITKFLSAAAILVALTSQPASALNFMPTSDIYCKPNTVGLKCEPSWRRQSQLERYYHQVILPKLNDIGYPGVIKVEDPADMKATKAGWGTRKDCLQLPAGATTRNSKVNTAKVIYCILKSEGYPVSKPKIIAGY